MIKTLDRLTVNQFIDLVSGNTSVLVGKLETVSKTELAVAMRNIVFEFKEIADSASVKILLSSIEELAKARISHTIFAMCKNLILLKEYGRVRDVLSEYGINASSMSDERVSAEVKSQYERVKSLITKLEDEHANENLEKENIRRSFDIQTAALMAYFKFQIDTSTMKATIYAHLIARHNSEIKAQLAAMNKK